MNDMKNAVVIAPAKLPINTNPQLRITPESVTPERLSSNANGTKVNTPVSKSNFIRYNIIKPTGNKQAPNIGLPVFVATVIANTAASPKIAPAINARINVSLVDMKTFDSPVSTIFVTNSVGSKYDIIFSLLSLVSVYIKYINKSLTFIFNVLVEEQSLRTYFQFLNLFKHFTKLYKAKTFH